MGEGTGRFLLPLRSTYTIEDTRFLSSGSFLAHTIYFGCLFPFSFPIPRGNLYPGSLISWLPLPTTIQAFLPTVKLGAQGLLEGIGDESVTPPIAHASRLNPDHTWNVHFTSKVTRKTEALSIHKPWR